MGARPGEVAFLLALFVLLGTLHGTRAQYGDYDDYDYNEDEFDYGDEEYEDEDTDAEPEDSSGDSEDGDAEGSRATANPQNQEFTPMCNNENCWIRVDWEPPPRDTWMSCLLGYQVGFRKTEDEWTWMSDEGTHRDLRSDKLFFFEEAEGTNHSLTIRNLEHQTEYVVTIEVFNPYGAPKSEIFHVETPPEPCRDASVPEPDKFVESSENSLSVHLASWQDANCETYFFVVEQRERGKEEWSSVSRKAKPGADILISNLSPATWYQIKVTGERSPGEYTSLEFEIATLATDGSGFSGCLIEKDVKYFGNTIDSKAGINQETCALLCFKKPACTHWTYNPTYEGGKCWMKTSDSGRAKSTTGSSSGQKACGARGFSLPEVAKTAATAMASCSPPWKSLDTGCYLFQEWNSTWYNARRECKQSGGYLLEIDSRGEEDAIIGEIVDRGWDGHSHYGFWIGLTDIFHDGTWVWDNLGKPLNFSNWASGEPNNYNGAQHCVVMKVWGSVSDGDNDFKWDDISCDTIKTGNFSGLDNTIGYICEAAGSSMTYTKETGKKWENENGKTSHMKVSMVHDEEECEKECTANVPCIAFTFIPGMEICALKAPKDAVTLVPAGGEMVSGKLDGERPSVHGKELESAICLPCLPECNVEEGTKLSGHNLYPLGAETQEECAAACLREPECHFWTHNPNIGRCWLKKSDIGKGPSTKGSNSGQKSCGVTEDDILSGLILEDGCDCTSETTEACSLEENTKYSGHNLYTTKGIKVGNMAGCASLCFEDSKCKFWTYNPRVSKCWMKTSDQGRSPSTKGSISGQKACGAQGVLPEEPESLPTSGEMTSPNFPSNYPNDLHERKTIEVAKGNVINIHFTDYELERPDQVDYLEITDGDGTLLGHFGAAHYVDNSEGGRRKGIKISDLTSITETVHVLFHTDDSVTRRGWRLEWSSSPAEGEQPTSGVLTSPNYPEEYQNNLDVTQKIQVPEGNTIWMRFTGFFEIERDADWVEVADKAGSILWDSMNDDFWEMRDGRFVSNTNTVEVFFHTDGSVTEKGWRLEWGMVGDEESIPKSGVSKSPNYPNSYPNDHDSTQTVEVSEGKTIHYAWTNFHTEGSRRASGIPYDYVEIVDEDGTSLMTKTAGYRGVTGDIDLPSPGTSNTNIMHVKFHAGGDTTRAGWRLEWNEQ